MSGCLDGACFCVFNKGKHEEISFFEGWRRSELVGFLWLEVFQFWKFPDWKLQDSGSELKQGRKSCGCISFCSLCPCPALSHCVCILLSSPVRLPLIVQGCQRSSLHQRPSRCWVFVEDFIIAASAGSIVELQTPQCLLVKGCRFLKKTPPKQLFNDRGSECVLMHVNHSVFLFMCVCACASIQLFMSTSRQLFDLVYCTSADSHFHPRCCAVNT